MCFILFFAAGFVQVALRIQCSRPFYTSLAVNGVLSSSLPRRTVAAERIEDGGSAKFLIWHVFVPPNLGAPASPWLQGPEEGSSDEEALAETRLEARPGFCPYVWLGGGGGGLGACMWGWERCMFLRQQANVKRLRANANTAMTVSADQTDEKKTYMPRFMAVHRVRLWYLVVFSSIIRYV